MNVLPSAKKLDLNEHIEFLDFTGYSKDVYREPDEILKIRLSKKAAACLLRSQNLLQHQCFEYQEEDVDGNVLYHVDSKIKVPAYAEKLFEGSCIDNVKQSVVDYVFSNVICYDDYFDCPCITLKDMNGDVVDIVKYRPQRDGYENLPKYLQEKAINKPEGRGKDFLYPLQVEMERLIKKEDFVFIGEGLKNALNALIRSVPYISIESTSNVKNDKLIAYVNKLFQDGVVVYGAMDGDAAGEKAFNAIASQMVFSIENLLDFGSGLDFTDYIRREKL